MAAAIDAKAIVAQGYRGDAVGVHQRAARVRAIALIRPDAAQRAD